jgi:hypothetical protein
MAIVADTSIRLIRSVKTFIAVVLIVTSLADLFVPRKPDSPAAVLDETPLPLSFSAVTLS